MKKPISLNKQELKVLLKANNIVIKPSYKHEDYILSSVSLPYPIKNKLNRLSKKFNISQSSVIRMLLESVKE